MESRRLGSSTPTRRANPITPKLKDSCDMCAASKVKCNKVKPLCGRCDKLGFPCFYSPARRVGRPHRPRNNPSIPPRANGAGSQGVIVTSDVPARGSSTAEGVSGSLTWDGGPSKRAATAAPSEGKQDGTVSLRGEPDSTGYDHDFIMDCRTPPRQIGQTGSETPLRPVLQAKATTPQVCISPSQATRAPPNSDDPTRPLPSPVQTSVDLSPELDCTQTTISLLQQLTAALSHLPPPPYPVSPSPLEEAFKTTAAATFRIAAVLVCPCSAHPDVALLAAGAIASVLDLHNALVQLGDASAMRVLAALPQAANLVVQFSERYGIEGPGQAAGAGVGEAGTFAPVLVVSLRTRLRAVMLRATRTVHPCGDGMGY